MPKPTYIDLFAGAGGLSEGFIRAGFDPIAHVEMDTAACYTLKTRLAYHYFKESGDCGKYISYLKGEITRDKLYKDLPEELKDSVINYAVGGKDNPKIHRQIDKLLNGRKVDIIVGGPPCQAYSLVGRARSVNGMENDPRNYLYVQYARYLEKYKPKLFVFENVIGLKSAKGGHYLRKMEALFDKKGYKMKLFTLEANKFGVLQNRKRIIIIGYKSGRSLPEDFDLEKIDLHPGHKVESVLSDLPALQAGEGLDKFTVYSSQTNDYLKWSDIRNGIDVLTQHIARPHTEQDREIYRLAVEKWNSEGERLRYSDLPARLQTHSNKEGFLDRFKVVAANEQYSQTILAHLSKDGHYCIHPDISQNRSITIREAARLQSFPDDFYFEGVREGVNRTPAFRQIGNAVPPLMATTIAQVLNDII